MKFVGAISSMLAGILTIVFFFLPIRVVRYIVPDPVAQNDNIWAIFRDGSTSSGMLLIKICAVITLIMAAVLILFGIYMLLTDCKVLKIKTDLCLINNVLHSFFVVVIAITFVAVLIMAKNYELGSSTEVGIGMWLVMCTAAITCAAGWVFGRKEHQEQPKEIKE